MHGLTSLHLEGFYRAWGKGPCDAVHSRAGKVLWLLRVCALELAELAIVSLSAVVYCIPVSASRSSAASRASAQAPSHARVAALSPRLRPIVSPESFKGRAYTALKDAIVSMDVYRHRADIRLDERQLASDLGVSRTPVREAMAQL